MFDSHMSHTNTKCTRDTKYGMTPCTEMLGQRWLPFELVPRAAVPVI